MSGQKRKILLSNKVFLFLFLFLVGGCGGDHQEVSVYAEEFRFTPKHIRVSALRPIRLVVTNLGRERHMFTSSLLSIPDSTVSYETERKAGFKDIQGIPIDPGKSIIVVLKAPPGSYGFKCLIQGHRGMEGTLTVEKNRSGPGS